MQTETQVGHAQVDFPQVSREPEERKVSRMGVGFPDVCVCLCVYVWVCRCGGKGQGGGEAS
jgi:hypothetical protein